MKPPDEKDWENKYQDHRVRFYSFPLLKRPKKSKKKEVQKKGYAQTLSSKKSKREGSTSIQGRQKTFRQRERDKENESVLRGEFAARVSRRGLNSFRLSVRKSLLSQKKQRKRGKKNSSKIQEQWGFEENALKDDNSNHQGQDISGGDIEWGGVSAARR